MKKLLPLLASLLLCSLTAIAQAEPYRILLSGASFAQPANRWFEMGCRAINAVPVNRAISAESIANTANRMADGTLYTHAQLDSIDVLVLMQVHEKDVYNSNNLRDRYTDYDLPFDNSDYAACFDYVIKRYITECYELRNDPASRYYGSPYGKPAIIVLCTHWNDSRTLYNSTVRQLARKWGLPVVEFDRLIGFSRLTKHPVTGENFSCLFTAGDVQQINGETHGWHPRHGEDSYIQQRMAAIFAATLRTILYPRHLLQLDNQH